MNAMNLCRSFFAVVELSRTTKLSTTIFTFQDDIKVNTRHLSHATQDTWVDGMSFVRQLYAQRGVSESSATILCASWRDTTKFQYSGYIKKWLCFCDRRESNPFQYDEINCLSFLTELFHMGRDYSTLNIARSALSTFLFSPSSFTIGNAPLIKRFMKGVFELRPSLPRYTYIWDVSIVLEFLSHYFPLEDLPLNVLSFKSAMLLALLSMQRIQTLKDINISKIEFFLVRWLSRLLPC